MDMEIIAVEVKKHEKFLRKPAPLFDFKKIRPAEIKKIVQDMRLAMKNANGVGLSANQVGLNLNLFVAELNGKFYAPRLQLLARL